MSATPSSASNATRAARRLRVTYIAALSAILLITIAAQVSLQYVISKQEADSTVINIAGRQRMLSQRIAKAALLVEAASEQRDLATFQASADQLRDALDLWATSHEGLTRRDASMGLAGDNSAEVVDLFGQLEPHFKRVVEHGRAMLQAVDAAG